MSTPTPAGRPARATRVAIVLALLAVVVFGAARPSLAGRVAAAPAGTPANSAVADHLAWTLPTAGAVVLILLAVLAWRRRRRSHEPEQEQVVTLPPTRLERIVTLVVALLILGILGVGAWQVIRLAPRPVNAPPVHPVPGGHAPLTGAPGPTGGGVSGIVFIVIGGVALAVMVAVGVAALVRRRRRQASAPVKRSDISTGLADAVAAGRSALRDSDDDRAAILACYLAMEQHLGRTGLVRAEADTPSEHLRRAIDAGVVRADSAGALLTLFHRARFSDHPVRETDRRTAERALAEVAGELREVR